MLRRAILAAGLALSAAHDVCPEIVGGQLSLLGGDGTLVLKDMAVKFGVSFSSNQTGGFYLKVVGDAKGNKFYIDGNEGGGEVSFTVAKRRSPEADAPGRKSKCSPDLPCYGRSTVILVDSSEHCADSSFDFTPNVQMANAPLVPLIISAILGPITGDPIITLTFAGWLARSMLVGDAWIGSLRYLDTDLLDTITKTSWANLFLFTIMIAGITGACIKSGGVEAIGTEIARIVKNSFLGQFAVYIAGFIFFIDDYCNTVIVGSTLRVITDTMRLSREKLAFLVDCTSGPIAGVMPLSTWIGYEVSLIKGEIERIGYDKEGGYTLFIMSISNRFYSWFMLIFVGFLILSGRDFGPMYWAEKRARETGVLSVDDTFDKEAKVKKGDKDDQVADVAPVEATEQPLLIDELAVDPRAPRRLINAALPFALFPIVFFPMLFYSGAKQVSWGGVGWNVGSRTIVGNADSWQTLYWTTGIIMLFQLVMYGCQYSKEWGGSLLNPTQCIDAFIKGTHSMYGGMVALLVAFTFAENMKKLLIADYLVDALGDGITKSTLPAVTFCLCAIYSFATGTSWGTMAVFFQPVIALAVFIYRDKGESPEKGLNTDEFTLILTRCIAAVLGGATWGDHCSFVSDTTILSAAASNCPLWAHYITQLPYCAASGALAILFGFLPCAAGVPAGACIAAAFVMSPLTIWALSSIPGFGGIVPIYCPDVGLVEGGFFANGKLMIQMVQPGTSMAMPRAISAKVDDSEQKGSDEA
ncbi:Na+/H+ antiporter family-domain-containing protein [Pelagophyceae sp. CCMP2097]|nr:Na+/H+ antiporter family-domain-containing protein [Pelagophyceae sp. CCMP2097]